MEMRIELGPRLKIGSLLRYYDDGRDENQRRTARKNW